MKRRIWIVVIVFALTGNGLKAQVVPGLGPVFKISPHTLYPVLTKDPIRSQNSGFSMLKVPIFSGPKLPQGAVFCRMEEQLWRTFNVWIKFRAGNDEMYRKLIETK